jgi:hypothetical protein
MRKVWTLLVLSVLVAGTALFVSSRDADAAFHLMRIHAVMGGVNGDDTIQYVELRMCSGGQNFLGGHTIKFYDAGGTLKATFTFPSTPFPTVPNAATGESVLIATSEFNTASTGPGMGGAGGDADFVFSMANTVGANSGDPLHPIQGVNGKVRFGHQESEGCDTNFTTDPHDIDSVAYGTATADLGSAAPALPNPSDNRALRLGTINGPTANNTDYSLQATSGSTKTVAVGSLTTDLDTPRNNSGEVATFSDDTDGDGVPDASDNCPTISNAGQANADGDTAGDACDLCPGTAPAAAVDANGCSQAQVDADADGDCDPGAPSGGPGPCTGTDNCPTTSNPGQANADGDSLGDACDPDADDDGYDNGAESGTPLCGNGKNDDDKTGAGLVADDAVIDDGCPGGPAQAGAFSEAQFKIGTDQLGPCSVGADAGQSPSWPSDFVSGGIPDSTDKINVLDLTSFIAPPATRKLDTAPGQANFNSRWDLNPGRGVFNNMINVTDLTALIAGTSGFPPMFGGSTKAFNGPVCTGA